MDSIRLTFSLLCLSYCVHYVVSIPIEFKIKRHTVCVNSDGSELNLYNLSLEKCAKTCFLRSACTGIAYMRSRKQCSLYWTDDMISLIDRQTDINIFGKQCVIIKRTSIHMIDMISTPSCALNEEYDHTEGKCSIQECPKQYLDLGMIYGNIRSIGSRFAFTCDYQIPIENGGVCLSDGTWSLEAQCGTCMGYLVPSIPDDQIFASSAFDEFHRTERARLDSIKIFLGGVWSAATFKAGGWVAGHYSADPNAYIQAMFTEVQIVKGIVTKGRNNANANQYVKTYKVSYSLDTNCQGQVETVKTNGVEKIFRGNIDINTASVQFLSTPIRARCVRLYPLEFNAHRSMRFDVIGCSENCTTKFVTGLYGAADNGFTSSIIQSEIQPSRARLDTHDESNQYGGWLIKDPQENEKRHYIEVKFRTVRRVSSVVTQGVDTSLHIAEAISNVYTKTYSIAYSRYCATFDNVIDPETNDIKIFTANTDWSSKVENMLPKPIDALCVRITPESYSVRKGLRFELKGCIDLTCPESSERTISPNVMADFEVRIYPERYTYIIAKTTCEASSGVLVDLTNPEVYRYVTTILKSCYVYHAVNLFWIGEDLLSPGVLRCAGVSEIDGTLEIKYGDSCGLLMGYICQWRKQ